MKKIILKRTNSAEADFQTLIRELDTDLRLRNGELMDIYDQYNVIEPIDTVVIAYHDEVAGGCGCFKKYADDTVEIKRMFVRHAARGNGISRLILNELELWSLEFGFAQAILETGGKQVEALALYQRSGYKRIPNYSQYINLADSFCFGKQLK